MGTPLFYLLCYNDQNNIWLLCHGCNITKGSEDTLNWFKGHPRFATSFLDAVTVKGGLHPGLLVDKIYKESGSDYVLQVDGESIRIPHESNSIQGIGEFVMSWYKQNHNGEYETTKALYEGMDDLTKTELQAIRELRNNCQDEEADKRQKHAFSVLHECTGVYLAALSQRPKPSESPVSGENSPSSSTSDIVQAEYEARAVQQAKERWHNRYAEKDIRRLIKKAYPNPSNAARISTSSNAKSRNIFLNELLSTAGDIGFLESKQIDVLLGTIKNLLEGKISLPSRQAFKKEFLELSKSPTKVAEEARQEAENQKLEKEAETQRRIEVEQENAQLRQLLAQAQHDTTLPSTSAVAQTALHTSASGSAFWQTASTADNPLRTTSKTSKKREFDATADTQPLDSEAKPIEQANKRTTTSLSQATGDNNEEIGIIDLPKSPR
jgi:signal transduction histidine kinase